MTQAQGTRAELSFLKADIVTRLKLRKKAKIAAGRIGEDGA